MVGIHPAYNILTFIFSIFFPAEDEAAVARISAKNGLESYAYNLRNSLGGEKLADKIEPADKSKLETAVNEAIKWLDASQEGSKEEYSPSVFTFSTLSTIKNVASYFSYFKLQALFFLFSLFLL
jgi:hypothetical protein